MNNEKATVDSAVSQISSVIANNIDSLFELDFSTGMYRTMQASPAVRDFFGDKGDCRQFLTRVLTGRMSPDSDLYEGFYIAPNFMGKIYSRYVNLGDEEVRKLLFLFFRVSEEKAFALFYPLKANLQGEERLDAKSLALNQSYLFSMIVDLDCDVCHDVYISEISNPNQDHLRLIYSEWRSNITPCIIDHHRGIFRKHTESGYVRTRLSRDTRFSFAVKMHALSGKTLWTQHTLLRIQDEDKQHLLFIYTVQDIDEQIRTLLEQSDEPIDLENKDDSSERMEVSSSMIKAMQPVSSFSELILDQVIVELNAHYNKKLSLKQLASKYYINTAYLGQLFIRKYDMTFHDYLAKIRMEKAAELLRTTNYSINQITEMTGISNPNYFHRLFKKYHRCTPLVYRARYKESI